MADFLNPKYLSAIKGFEGYAPRASWDYKQNSVGYGTKARYPGEVIDRDEAERRFGGEIGQAHNYVESAFPGLAEGPRAALTSLTYNAGPGWINSGLGNAVRNDDWATARKLFMSYNKAGGQTIPGLADRRAQEAAWIDGNAPDERTSNMTPLQAAMYRRGQRPGDTEDPAALSNGFFAGPGALSQDEGGGSDPGNALQGIGAYLMGRDNSKALGIIPSLTKDDNSYGMTVTPDGTVLRINRKKGTVEPVGMVGQKPRPAVIDQVPDGSGVPGATIPKQRVENPDGSVTYKDVEGAPTTANRFTPGEKKDDETFAKEHADWKANGGFAKTEQSIKQMRGVIDELRDSKNAKWNPLDPNNKNTLAADLLGPTGPVNALIGDTARSFLNPKSVELENRARDLFQQTARQVLGSQYTQKEGETQFASNYDKRLSPEVNARNLERKLNAMEKQARAKQEASTYFEKNGSLRGFNYATPSFDSLGADDEAPSALPAGVKSIELIK